MRIRREDVDHVRERTPIDEVVAEHVTLRNAGVGSMKGLCPFHDERTPSFHVRPQVGLWHCFGCGEGGDVISFVQKVDALGFTEAVELLAGGDVPVAEVARRVYVSERQLQRRFVDRVGYGPKTLQRVLRFRRFLANAESTPGLDLAGLAASAGYSDQAHLTRECNDLAGTTPAQLLRSV